MSFIHNPPASRIISIDEDEFFSLPATSPHPSSAGPTRASAGPGPSRASAGPEPSRASVGPEPSRASKTAGPSPRSSPFPSSRFSPYPIPSETSFHDNSDREDGEPTTVIKTIRFSQPTAVPSRSTRSKSSGNNKSTSERTIPKPQGEMGRPGRGGYSLRTALGWEETQYKKAKKTVLRLVEDKLDGSVPYTLQPAEQPGDPLNIVRSEMITKYPALHQYEDNWATNDFIRAALKYRQTIVKQETADIRAMKQALEVLGKKAK
ncbi:hypothetical protein VKT23_019414 [Stygiomarasmius scandens]|uniref:Uncharacterized protein n=1 Tax=Marasmiellus scandens TaxID=2682957 RepID=A0ABR1INM1_9AGAR